MCKKVSQHSNDTFIRVPIHHCIRMFMLGGGGGGKCESFQGANQFLKGKWRHEARYKMPPTHAPATLDLAIFHYVTTCIHAIEVL